MTKVQPNDEFLRKRMERQRRLRKRRLIVLLIFFIALLLCVGVVFTLTIFFPIEKINISGSKVYTAEQIEKASSIDLGDNLFAFSKKQILFELKEKLPFIESVSIKRKFPDTLNIKVTDAEEFMVYNCKNKYYTVSESGWVLEELNDSDSNLPIIKGVKVNCKVGTEITYEDEKQKELIEIITKTLSKENIKVDYIDISDRVNLTLGVEGRFTVELGTSNDLEGKILHLASMIKNSDKQKCGKINLSMWTSNNKEGTFVPENTQ